MILRGFYSRATFDPSEKSVPFRLSDSQDFAGRATAIPTTVRLHAFKRAARLLYLDYGSTNYFANTVAKFIIRCWRR